MFDVAPAFSSNPKDNDGEIEVTLTDAFQIKGDLLNVSQLSFCPRKSIEELCLFFPFPLLRPTWVFKRGRWSQESPGLRRSASSCWACFCWVHLRDYRDSLPSLSQTERRSQTEWRRPCWWEKEDAILLLAPARMMLMARSTVEKNRCPLPYWYVFCPLVIFCHLTFDSKWLFCWLLAQMYDSKVWLLWLFAPRLTCSFTSWLKQSVSLWK